MKTLLLSKTDVQAALTMDVVLDAVEDAYRAYQTDKLDQPPIVSMEAKQFNGETDIKACYNALNRTISAKIVSGFYDNERLHGLPNMLGNVLLFDGTTGAPLSIMDGSLITGLRTGAAGAVSCKYLARKDSKVIAVFGTGNQAKNQVFAICQLFDIQEVRVFSPRGNSCEAYKTAVEAATKARVVVCSSTSDAMTGADICVSTTPTTEFIGRAADLAPGMHIVAVGADMEGKNEWDPEVFAKADKVVCDSIPQCLARGETRNAILAGTIREEDIYGEIGEIIIGKKPGRTSDTEITVFDTTGMGAQDNTTALAAYTVAMEKGLGTYFEFI